MPLFGSKKKQAPASTLPPKPKITFERYVDPTGEFSSKRLKYSLWFTEHKLILYKVSLGVLSLFSIIIWILGIWWWSDYIIFETGAGARLRKSLANFTNSSLLASRFTPTTLAVVDTVVTAGGVDKYDISAEVVNPNDRFIAIFDYYFLVDGEKTPVQTTVLLPKDDRPIAYFGLKKTVAPNAPVLFLENVKWQRVANDTIADTQSWQAERLNFSVKDFAFTRSESTDGVGSHMISFTLTNNSSFAYTAPRFYVALLLQQGMVGLVPLSVPQFKSLEERKIDIRSFVPTLNVTDVQIFPLINVYDDTVYRKPER